ncbi:hypothetical protein I3F58_11000 [Streptomyces sp. MUM 203J]|uniref:ATP-grasp domain-containing protein n=1 Tax=Streptomyces sp. MUM 203J TaxID=2791990 RepID=UPI001F03A17F|nr:hypothetical protein [Streptomyces sp. MUM 203J]MCH0540085.1 hypothetical protein [Streptomyces sp. MUM 203J]
MTRALRVGTFLATGPIGASPALARMPGTSTLTVPARERCLELLSGLEGVEFTHDLNLDRTVIRDGRVHHGDVCLNDLDLYVWYAQIDRTPGSYHREALWALGLDTRVVVDPDSFAVGVDKYRAHLTLSRAGARVPETVLLHPRNLGAAEDVLRAWGRALLKPRHGFYGQGVLLVDDFATLRDAVGYLTATAPCVPDETLLLERFYENDPADWTSVTVVGGAVMYGYRKRAARWATMRGGATKVYDPAGAGGEVDLCPVSPAQEELALRAQKALGAEIVGFDMILHEGEPIIVDENTTPGLYPELFDAVGKELGGELFRVIACAVDDCRSG